MEQGTRVARAKGLRRPSPTAKMVRTPVEVHLPFGKASFETLRDLYETCLEEPRVFDDLAAAVAQRREARRPDQWIDDAGRSRLASELLSFEVVLPERCFNALYEHLCKKRDVELARGWLKANKSWDDSKAAALRHDASHKSYPPRKPSDDKGADTDSGGCHWDDCPDIGGQ